MHLSPDEFDALTEREQDEYLALLEGFADEWVLQPHQQRAEDISHQVNELLFGGAAGPGKSEWLLYHAHHLSKRFEKHRTLILRSNFPQLRRSLILRSFEKFAGEAKWRAADREWHYPNGSIIEFGHCETVDDTRIYLSAEYDCILIDEATEFGQDQYEMLRSRCRTTAAKRRAGVKPHMGCATNPGGPGHGFFKQRFVDATLGGEHVVETLDDPDDPASLRRVAFVPARVEDNAYIDPMYRRELNAMSDPVKRAQYRDGDWDVFAGMYFTEWSRQLHVVMPFDVPFDWPRFTGHDHGYANPACHLWAAVDHDGRVWAYREFYATELTPSEQAARIKRSETVAVNGITKTESVDYRVCDPSIWSRTGAGPPIAQQLADAGLIGLRKANNARVDGWTRVREFLRPDTMAACHIHREQGMSTCPQLHVFDSCANLIRTIPEMVHAANNPEDLDTTLEDHAVDALRYLLMSRPRRPVVPRHEPVTMEEKIAVDLQRRQRAAGRKTHDVLGRM